MPIKTTTSILPKEPSKRGGARPGAGRARMPSGSKAVRRSITIDPLDESTLINLGGGLSMGIRMASQLVRNQTKNIKKEEK